MQIYIAFPKDKEEMKKKRMEALMRKISAGEPTAGTSGPPIEIDLTGREGERRLEAITQELR